MSTEQKDLEFEGTLVTGTKLKVAGEVETAYGKTFHHRETVDVVARARVTDIKFPGKKGVTREHTAEIVKATLVDEELAADVLDESEERTTGQIRLLSIDGEHRRALREVLAERRRQIELGHDVEHDDGHEAGDAFGRIVEDGMFVALLDLKDKADEYDLVTWLKANEHELVQAAAVCVAGVEWCRRRLWEHEEDQRRIAAEELAAERERVAEASAVHNDEEADKRERRGVEDGDGNEEGDDDDAE